MYVYIEPLQISPQIFICSVELLKELALWIAPSARAPEPQWLGANELDRLRGGPGTAMDLWTVGRRGSPPPDQRG